MYQRSIAFFLTAMTAVLANAEQTILKCSTVNIDTKDSVMMSVQLDEKQSLALVNGTRFANIQFDATRISGTIRRPVASTYKIVRESSFNLDRVTGRFSYFTITDTESAKPTDEEIQELARLNMVPTGFLGACQRATAQF